MMPILRTLSSMVPDRPPALGRTTGTSKKNKYDGWAGIVFRLRMQAFNPMSNRQFKFPGAWAQVSLLRIAEENGEMRSRRETFWPSHDLLHKAPAILGSLVLYHAETGKEMVNSK